MQEIKGKQGEQDAGPKAHLLVPAFTILEVTVAMILAVISIGIAYTAYRTIGRSYREYDQKNKKLAESILLDKLLKRDFVEAEQIQASNEGLIFKKQEKEIYYSFEDDYVLRDQEGLRKDTFFVAPREPQSFFKGREAFSGEVIDRTVFTTKLAGREINHVYTRQYSAEELMRIENN